MRANTFILLLGLTLTGISLSAYSYPVFSSSLGGGGTYSGNRISGSPIQRTATARKKIAHKTVLRYTPSQFELTESQMKSLMPLMRRLQDGQAEDVEIVGIAKDGVAARDRMSRISRILASYAPNMPVRTRSITDEAVIPGNDNTVEIIEYR